MVKPLEVALTTFILSGMVASAMLVLPMLDRKAKAGEDGLQMVTRIEQKMPNGWNGTGLIMLVRSRLTEKEWIVAYSADGNQVAVSRAEGK